MSNLSPEQFVQQHADFHRWAKGEMNRIDAEHEFEPGKRRYPPEAGRRLEDLRRARTWLSDNYSDVAHDSFGKSRPREDIVKQVGVPLHEALPLHHHIVNEYLEGNR